MLSMECNLNVQVAQLVGTNFLDGYIAPDGDESKLRVIPSTIETTTRDINGKLSFRAAWLL